MLNFGAGALFGTRNDITGQTPVQFGALQDVTADFSFDEKPLQGTNQFPILVARGTAKWSLKAKMGVISATLLNNLFFGQTQTTGQILPAINEAHTLASSTTTQTAYATNSSTFKSDEGVSYSGPLGLPLTMTTGTPSASGQYKVSASGLYTFSSTESAIVWFNYLYTTSTGEQITLSNQQLGTTPTFSCVFRNRDPNTGLYTTLVVNKVTCSKLTLGSKTSDFTIPEMDFTIMDDGTGNIGTLSLGDAS